MYKKNRTFEHVKAKKHLGQHFLKNEDIAFTITDSLPSNTVNVLEIGPGMGVLTKYLAQNKSVNLKVVEIDEESVVYLLKNNIIESKQVVFADFLRYPLHEYFGESFTIIGNFPYNISTQILFKVLEYRDMVPCVVGMFQKEVAERVASNPGNRDYGIISVLLQAYYDIEYVCTVQENDFIPPPKVKSGVIRLIRNNVKQLDCDEKMFTSIVKLAFNQRRKTMRNSLKSILPPSLLDMEILQKRPEQLHVSSFVELTNTIANERVKE